MCSNNMDPDLPLRFMLTPQYGQCVSYACRGLYRSFVYAGSSVVANCNATCVGPPCQPVNTPVSASVSNDLRRCIRSHAARTSWG